jgi:hypothetical protein
VSSTYCNIATTLGIKLGIKHVILEFFLSSQNHMSETISRNIE